MILALAALGGGVLLIANGGLGRVASALGTTFTGFVTNLTATPVPSAPPPTVADAPVLEAPDEPYTNQAAVDLIGTIPAAVAGQPDAKIRIYVAIGEGEPGVVKEIPVGASPHFIVPVTLSPGANTFTATIVSAGDLESEPSATVAYVFDKSKPKVTVSSPKNNAVVNAKTVKIVGLTQARSQMSVHNLTTNVTVSGTADGKGAFSVVLPLGTGTNKIEVTATDPAGNAQLASLSVRRGTGALTANVSASFYTIKVSKLPEQVRISVSITDPDGKALEGARVTFTIAIPGVPAIASSQMTTSSRGTATFTTTIPKGATAGRQATITAIVDTDDFGSTTDRTVISITK
jgi:bacillopeptidase F